MRLDRRSFLSLPGSLAVWTSPRSRIATYALASRAELVRVYERLSAQTSGWYLEAIAAAHMPQLLAIDSGLRPRRGILELRTFTAPVQPRCFAAAGIRPLLHLSDGTWLLHFEDLAARPSAWAEFSAMSSAAVRSISLYVTIRTFDSLSQ